MLMIARSSSAHQLHTHHLKKGQLGLTCSKNTSPIGNLTLILASRVFTYIHPHSVLIGRGKSAAKECSVGQRGSRSSTQHSSGM
jgi:hypothetical protein